MSNEIKAQAVMDFVEMIRGAYASGFIDNHPTNYDIYRSAQMHVKDRYGAETNNWDDELAEESRKYNHDKVAREVLALRESLRMKEAELERLTESVLDIVSAAVNSKISGSDELHVDHLYDVISRAHGALYNENGGGGDDRASSRARG